MLPWHAPNPREWVKIARPFEKKMSGEEIGHVDGHAFAYRIDTWNSKDGDIVRTIGFVHNLRVLHAAFDAALTQYPNDHLTARQGAHILGDSNDLM